MVRKAECCCGACEVEVCSEPTLHAACSCNNCKKRTGSAFGISAYFMNGDFKVLKENSATYIIETEQGRQVRNFCKSCGTTLYWKAASFKGLVGVAGGCFTEIPLSEPGFSTMNEKKCSWVNFSPTMGTSFPSVSQNA